MPVSVLQTVFGTDSAGVTATAAVTMTVQAGSYLDFFVCRDNGNTISGVASVPVLTWTLRNAGNDTGNAERLEQWTSSVTSAGSITVTATLTSSGTFAAAACKEIGGSSGFDSAANAGAGAKASNQQSTVVVGNGNLTTGNFPVLTSQPALLSAWSMNTQGSSNPTVTGTSTTSDGTGVQVGTGINLVRAGSRRVTSTAATAVQFTPGDGTGHWTFGVAFLETPSTTFLLDEEGEWFLISQN